MQAGVAYQHLQHNENFNLHIKIKMNLFVGFHNRKYIDCGGRLILIGIGVCIKAPVNDKLNCKDMGLSLCGIFSQICFFFSQQGLI